MTQPSLAVTPWVTLTSTFMPTMVLSQIPPLVATPTRTLVVTPSATHFDVTPTPASTSILHSIVTISLDNAQRVTELVKLEGWGKRAMYSPDGRFLLVGNTLYDAQTLDELGYIDTWYELGYIQEVPKVFSSDGKLIASGGCIKEISDEGWFKCVKNSIGLWKVPEGTLIHKFKWDGEAVNDIAFSSHNVPMLLAAGADDNLVYLFELFTGRERIASSTFIAKGEGHLGPIYSVDFSPDGAILASGSFDHTIRLWQVSRDGLRLLHILKGHKSGIRSVVFSPDGTILASGSLDHTVRLWRVSDGKLLHTLEGHAGSVESVAFSPDGNILASGSLDHTIRLWQVENGTLLHTLKGHTGAIWSVDFSPDGLILVSASDDGTVRLWGVQTR